MPAFLDNPAVIEHNHPVSAKNRAQPVRDYQSRATLKQLLHRFFDEPLTLAVETRCRFVENYNRGVLEKYARDRETLALTAGELHSSLANKRIEALYKAIDELGRMRRGRGAPDVFLTRHHAVVHQRISDVLANRAAEQRWFLWHHSDRAAKLRQLKLSYVVPVDFDSTRRHVPESRNQRSNRRLSSATRPHQSDNLSWRDSQRDISQHIGKTGSVGKRDVSKLDLSANRLVEGLGLFRIGDRRFGFEQIESSPRRANSFLINPEQRAQRPDCARDIQRIQ